MVNSSSAVSRWKSGQGTIFTGALRRGDSSEALPLLAASRCVEAELHNGLLAIEIERPVKEEMVKTVRIVNGEMARQSKRAAMSDAE
jgi:hypothetical protein